MTLRNPGWYRYLLVAAPVPLVLLSGNYYFSELVASTSQFLSLVYLIVTFVVVTMTRKQKRAMAVFSAICVLSLATHIAYHQWPQTALAGDPPQDPGSSLRILQLNGGHIRAAEQAAEWIIAEDPDVLFIVQGTSPLLNAPSLHAEFPFRIQHPSRAVMAKLPLRSLGDDLHSASAVSNHIARYIYILEFEEGEVLLGGPTVPSSRTQQLWASAQQTLAETAQAINLLRTETGWPAIVASDFNSTPFGAGYNGFADRSGLRDANPRLLRPGTWPANFPAYLRVSIDHVFVSDDIEVLSHRIGPNLSGDHRPVIAELSIGSQSSSLGSASSEAASDL